MSFYPSSTTQSGWPEFILDSAGDNYVLLRDGTPTGDFTGHSCLYGILDDRGYIERDHLYVPSLGSTPDSTVMSGGSWMDPEDMLANGIPPISIPPEPVTVPEVEGPKYPVDTRLLGDLINRFKYHPPGGNQSERYGKIRDAILHLAVLVCRNAPDSRERSTALTHLDMAMMMANAAIARNESTPLPP